MLEKLLVFPFGWGKMGFHREGSLGQGNDHRGPALLCFCSFGWLVGFVIVVVVHS